MNCTLADQCGRARSGRAGRRHRRYPVPPIFNPIRRSHSAPQQPCPLPGGMRTGVRRNRFFFQTGSCFGLPKLPFSVSAFRLPSQLKQMTIAASIAKGTMIQTSCLPMVIW